MQAYPNIYSTTKVMLLNIVEVDGAQGLNSEKDISIINLRVK